MNEIKTKTEIRQFRNFRIELVSDIFGIEKGDTTVKILPNRITNDTLFVISGDEIEQFINDFDKLVTKYRI